VHPVELELSATRVVRDCFRRATPAGDNWRAAASKRLLDCHASKLGNQLLNFAATPLPFMASLSSPRVFSQLHTTHIFDFDFKGGLEICVIERASD